MKEAVFDVFARKERGDMLQHIGYVDAMDAELARVYAWKTYDEQNWFEMCVVPRAAIFPVNRTDGPFAGNATGRAPVQGGQP
ncbi:MAG: hypothetical protein RQ751_10475 [Longimicrobiales bacterium]|nr:hypothetical protein [Longimicrobiales bacterium]